MRLPGVEVELRAAADETVLARTVTDGVGQVNFPDVPAGRYIVRATRPGFVSRDSPAFDVRPGLVNQILLDIQLDIHRRTGRSSRTVAG